MDVPIPCGSGYSTPVLTYEGDERKSVNVTLFAKQNAGKLSSRKSHRKARTGCGTCKRRKVKCDEVRPACGNCVKHSVSCDFQSLHSPSDSTSPGVPAIRSSSSVAIRPPSCDTPLLMVQSPSSNLNMLHLELLHNFSTSTAFTLHSDPTMRTLYRVNVPQLAFSYDYVMHSVLAISALHLAYCVPQKQDFYLSHAAHHHQAGLRIASAMLPQVTDENASALYIFTAITCIYSIGSRPKLRDSILVDEPSIWEGLILFRGTRSIIESTHHALTAGVFGPMFLDGARRQQFRESQAKFPTREDEHLAELQALINATCRDQAMLRPYTAAITELRKSYAVVYQRPGSAHQSGDLFIWLFVVSGEYLQLLRERTQESLAIFAHFCVIPNMVESRWWAVGWGTYLLSHIYRSLDEEHRLWIRWPMEEIGWVPGQEGVISHHIR